MFRLLLGLAIGAMVVHVSGVMDDGPLGPPALLLPLSAAVAYAFFSAT